MIPERVSSSGTLIFPVFLVPGIDGLKRSGRLRNPDCDEVPAEFFPEGKVPACADIFRDYVFHRSIRRQQRNQGIFLSGGGRWRQVPLLPVTRTLRRSRREVHRPALFSRTAAARDPSWVYGQERRIINILPAALCRKAFHGRRLERVMGRLDAGKRRRPGYRMFHFGREKRIGPEPVRL